jgi:hypothetical protein
MGRHKNTEHFKISDDKKVRVVLEFDVAKVAGDKLIMKIAADYLNYYTASGIHKSYGYGIDVQHKV